MLNREVTDVTDASPWLTEELDLDAYLRRIGSSAAPPSRAALDALHEAHVRAFTFDNIDVLLEQHPGVRLDAVQDKFVRRGRGGYCFEHAVLFAAALERLGYSLERRLGRVGDASAPRTHMTVEVNSDGQRLLCDPGFGMSLLRPLPWVDDAEDDYLPGWRHRLRRTASGGWALHRLRDGGWEVAHTVDELEVEPLDVVMGHHFTSTFPGSHFTTGLMVAKHLPGRHVTVTHETVTIRTPGEPTQHRPLRDGEIEDWLRELEVPLTSGEEGKLLETLQTLTA